MIAFVLLAAAATLGNGRGVAGAASARLATATADVAPAATVPTHTLRQLAQDDSNAVPAELEEDVNAILEQISGLEPFLDEFLIPGIQELVSEERLRADLNDIILEVREVLARLRALRDEVRALPRSPARRTLLQSLRAAIVSARGSLARIIAFRDDPPECKDVNNGCAIGQTLDDCACVLPDAPTLVCQSNGEANVCLPPAPPAEECKVEGDECSGSQTPDECACDDAGAPELQCQFNGVANVCLPADSGCKGENFGCALGQTPDDCACDNANAPELVCQSNGDSNVCLPPA